jgi:nicotinamide-nucleotide amidase
MTSEPVPLHAADQDSDVEAARSLARAIGEELQRRSLWIGAAESLTGGMLSSFLAEAPNASAWFQGGIVAYSRAVKLDVLHVRPGPVVSEAAALDMARGAAELLGAAITIGVTGVGGPDPQDDQPPGTVWMAVHAGGVTAAELLHLEGEPEQICRAACRASLELVTRRLVVARNSNRV